MTEEHCTPLSTLTASLPKEATPCTTVQEGGARPCKRVLHDRARGCCTTVQGGVARPCKGMLHSRARGRFLRREDLRCSTGEVRVAQACPRAASNDRTHCTRLSGLGQNKLADLRRYRVLSVGLTNHLYRFFIKHESPSSNRIPQPPAGSTVLAVFYPAI